MRGVFNRAGESFYARVEDFQRRIIRGALRRHRGNQIAAAAELGIHRNTLARYLNLLGIDPSAFYRKREHEKYLAQHGWRAVKIAEGLCANCFKNPAGGIAGSKTCCATCAEKKRKRENARAQRLNLYKTKRPETTAAVERLLRLASAHPDRAEIPGVEHHA
jgi:hypothetical protein